jgi:hypothetical protein
VYVDNYEGLLEPALFDWAKKEMCFSSQTVGSHVNSPFGTSAHNLLHPFATPSFLAS